MRQRDKDQDVADGVRTRVKYLERDLAELFVEYSEKTETGVVWHKAVHRKVGEYIGLRRLLWSERGAPPTVKEKND